MAKKRYNFEQDARKIEPEVETIKKLQQFSITHTPLDTCHSKDELDFEGYLKYLIGTTYWFMHPELVKILEPYNLSRYAMLVNMRQYRDKLNGITLSSFIFTQDKEQLRNARGLDDNDFDRFDTFRCTPDGNGNFRKNGSMNGPKAMSQKRRDKNKIFLQTLMYGLFSETNNIRCAYTGENVETLRTVDDNSNIEKFIDIYHLHHAYYVDGTSIDKSEGPSHYLNKQTFEFYSHTTIIEFLGCLVLSDSSHSRIHKAQREDDITGWFKKFNRGEISYLPYHWINEGNYLNTLERLADMCPYFDLGRAPSYYEFLAKNTSAKNLAALLPGYVAPVPTSQPVNNFSQMFGYEDLTKIDPTLQSTIPYTVEIGQQQILDFGDTLPIVPSLISL